MADQDNPKVLLAFHRGLARGVEGSTQVTVEVVMQGLTVIGLMSLAHLALGGDWAHLLFGGGTGVGLGIAIRKLFDGRGTASPAQGSD